MQSDCEKLVLPILGLYSLILKKKDTDQMREIQKCIDKSRERFFPHSCELKNEDGTFASRKLFKNLAPMMEEYVETLIASEESAFTPVAEARNSAFDPSPVAADLEARECDITTV